jgi:hypothetical protein
MGTTMTEAASPYGLPSPAIAKSESECGLQVFHSPHGEAFVDVHILDHRETWPLQSKTFRRLLAAKLYEFAGTLPTPAQVKRYIDHLETLALSEESTERDVHVRVACSAGRVYVDLAGAKWQVVEITGFGWRVTTDPPVRFIRTPEMLPLPVPEAGGSIETLRSFINVRDDDDFVLLVGWLLHALRNSRPHPPLVLSGGEGSAKSTLMAMLMALIDPNAQPLGGLPRTERALRAGAEGRYLVPYDNVSEMTRQISDALCRNGTHPVIINGIVDVVTHPDLADRCLFITCDSIPDDRRRTEAKIWTEFGKEHARLLGVLCDAVARGLATLPNMQLEGLPRMADFSEWVAACETEFWPAGTFATAYASNRAEAAERLIETDPLVLGVQLFMANRTTWTGSATKLYVALAPTFEAAKGKVPITPRDLGAKLRNAKPRLNKIGIGVEFHLEGRKRDRIITISAVPKVHAGCTTASTSSGAPPSFASSALHSSSASSAPSAPSASNTTDSQIASSASSASSATPAPPAASSSSSSSAPSASSASPPPPTAKTATDKRPAGHKIRGRRNNRIVGVTSWINVGGRMTKVFKRRP